MATLAIPLIGGMVGSAMLPAGLTILGATVSGFSVGWTIGSLIGNAAMSKSVTNEGPRMSSLDPKLSTYTRALARVYGSGIVEGNSIWHINIEEVVVKKSSGGKGGKSVTNKMYYYYWSFSVDFCEGEKKIIKIWCDGKLIYDRTNQNVMEKYPGVVTAYTGSEVQDPSPLQEAYEGVGNVPAYRGTCYADLKRLPLADFGNKPVITTALVSSGADNRVSTNIAYFGGTATDTWAMAPNKQDVVLIKSGQIRRFKITDRGGEQVFIDITLPATYSEWNTGVPHIETDGDYAYFAIYKATTLYAARVNLVTHEVERISNGIGSVTLDEGQFRCDAENNVYVSSYDKIWFEFKVNIDASDYLREIDQWTGYSEIFMCRGLGLDVWAVSPNTSTNQLRFQRYNKGEAAGESFFIDGNVTSINLFGIFYHAATGYLIVANENILYGIDPETETKIWQTTVNSLHTSSGYVIAQYTCVTNFFHIPIFESYVSIDLTSGETGDTAEYDSWSGVGASANGDDQFYDDRTHSLIIRDSSYWKALPLERLDAGGQITVQSFLEDISVEVGHDLADITATDFSTDLMSYTLTQRAPARNFIEPILGTFLGDAVESDYKIKFVKRSDTSDGSVPSDDLIIIDEDTGNIINEMNTQEVELPRQIDFVYVDPDLEYRNKPVTAKRNSNACFTRSIDTIATPAAITQTQAKDIAPKLLRQIWVQRWSFKFHLTWKYLKYDPTDVLTVTADNDTHSIMITKMDWQPNMSLLCEGVAVKSATYSLVGAAQSNLGFDPSILEVPGQTIFHMLDLPAMRDQDLHNPILVLAANGYYTGWRGCLLEQSTDLEEWSGFTPVTVEAAIGTTADALPDHSCTTWDRTSSFDVTFYDNEATVPTTSTEDAIIGDRSINLMLVGNEIIQALTVTLVAQNRYTFSNLIRGRFGTEYEAAEHVAGERVVILDETTLKDFDRQTSDVAVSKYYRGVSFGNAMEIADHKSFTYNAGNLRPWTVVYLIPTRDGSNNLTVTWTRRGRRKPLPFWGPVLEEDSEAYEVDVLDAPGGSVVRTITSTPSGNGSVVTPGSQTVLYDADDITADGLTPGDPHIIRIYQMSATVGRGNTRDDTV